MHGPFINDRHIQVSYRHKNYFILPDSSFEDEIEASLPTLRTQDKYKGWSDEAIISDVIAKMKIKNARTLASHFKTLNQMNPRPDVSGWGEYTYEEILNMYDNGCNIPDEVLQWARAEANEDVINYQIDNDIIATSTDLATMEADLNDDRTVASKRNVVLYSEKAQAQSEQMQSKYEDLNEKNSDVNKKQTSIVASKKASASKIAAYKKELETLEQKINNGEELSTNEQFRYRSLSGKIEKENKNISQNTNDLQSELNSLFKNIDETERLAAINERIASELDTKNMTFVGIETKSNSGILPVINKNIGISNNPYVYMALSGQLFSNTIDLTQDMHLNSDTTTNSSFESENFITGVESFETATDDKTSESQNENISEPLDTTINEEDSEKTLPEHSEPLDSENTLSEPETIIQTNANTDSENNPDVTEKLPAENPVTNEENSNINNQKQSEVNNVEKTDITETDTKKDKPDENLDLNTNNENPETGIVEPEGENAQFDTESADKVLPESDDKDLLLDNNELPNNLEVKEPETNQENSSIEGDEKIQNSQKENSEKSIPDKIAGMSEKMKESMKLIQKPDSQKSDNQKRLSKLINSLSPDSLDAKIETTLENLSNRAISENDQQQENPKEENQSAADKLNKAGNADTNTNILNNSVSVSGKPELPEPENNAKMIPNPENNSTEQSSDNIEIINNTNVQADNNKDAKPELNNNTSKPTGQPVNTETQDSEKITEKEPPKTESEESPEIQQVISQRTTVSDEEILAVTGDVEEINNNTEEVQQSVAAQIENSKPEYLKNPMLVDNTEQVSEEITDFAAEDAKNAEKHNLTKEESMQKVKESVKETMQATLSSVNQKVQSKDSDNDKKHKMFTRFEIEKQDAIRKTVQKISNAKDAR